MRGGRSACMALPISPETLKLAHPARPPWSPCPCGHAGRCSTAQHSTAQRRAVHLPQHVCPIFLDSQHERRCAITGRCLIHAAPAARLPAPRAARLSSWRHLEQREPAADASCSPDFDSLLPPSAAMLHRDIPANQEDRFRPAMHQSSKHSFPTGSSRQVSPALGPLIQQPLQGRTLLAPPLAVLHHRLNQQRNDVLAVPRPQRCHQRGPGRRTRAGGSMRAHRPRSAAGAPAQFRAWQPAATRGLACT